MTTDEIRYDLLAQEALRGVVKRVLTDVARYGLPGEHHFFIAFATQFPGVRISKRLHAQHPEEMTIVLQHQFWDLTVNDHAFEIGLSFSGVPERLYIPFDAIKGFFDPSVQFGLQFEVAGIEKDDEVSNPAESDANNQPAPISRIGEAPAAKPTPLRKKTPKGAASEPNETQKPDAKPVEPSDETPPEPPTTGGGSSGAQVVSLDRFRKKP